MNVAVDSGASGARYILFLDPRAPVEGGDLEGVNYNTRGREGVFSLLRSLCSLRSMAAAAGDVAHIAVAMAGVGRPDVRRRALDDLRAALAEHMPRADLFLFHDAEAALWRVLEGEPGVVVSAGTGSVAQAVTADGRELRCGGWGYRAGDEGSGYWIAIRALTAIFRSLDGRGPEPGFAGALVRAAGVEAPYQLVDWVQTEARTPREIAELAAVMDDATTAGDPQADEILGEAGRHLAELTLRLLAHDGVPPNIGLNGSILLKSPRVKEAFVRVLRARHPAARFLEPRLSAAQGVGLLFADRLARGVAPDVEAARR